MSTIAQAAFSYPFEEQQFTAIQANNCGDVLQLPDGRASVLAGLVPAAAGDKRSANVVGNFNVVKGTTYSILRGGKVYWQRDNLQASFTPGAAGFYIGRCSDDAPASQAFVSVDLNAAGIERLKMDSGLWNSTPVKTAGSPAATRDAVGAGIAFALDNTNEAQKIDAISVDSVRTIDGPILEARLTVTSIGNNAALTIALGLANGTHASAFSSITQQAAFSLAGNSLELNAQSKDGTTTVAATDTTILLVANTYNEFWIDARDPTDVKFYVDGVQVVAATTFVLTAATGPLFPLLWVGKTANATLGAVKVDFLRLRTSD